MRMDYNSINLSPREKAVLIRTIYRNKFIPVRPYKEQLYAIADTHKRKLVGGSAYSGKSILGAMLALQWFEQPNYRCLILRKTYDDVIATGGIVDYLKDWLAPFIALGEVEHNKQEKVFINLRTGAKIFYNYALYADDFDKYKSRQYHRIIIDEASEMVARGLKFINRSLRPNEEDRIPLGLYYISNPAASSGIKYLRERFVAEKGPYPFYEMNFWNNPHVDPVDYKETLSELAVADYEFQMGNWDYELKSGDIFNYDMINSHFLTLKQYEELIKGEELLQLIRGWDIAATEKEHSDYTACTLLECYKSGLDIVREQISFKLEPGKLEARMHQIMDRDGDEVSQWIELQPAAAGKIVNRYWYEEFKEHKTKFIPVFKNKVIRAGRVVPRLKTDRLYFVEDEVNPYKRIFTRQAINFPNFDKKDEETEEEMHDDRIDSLSLPIFNLHQPKTRLRVHNKARSLATA